MAAADPARRSTAASIAAFSRWAKQDPVDGTAAARAALADKFEREADPDGTLPPAERARRAECARKAHYRRLGLRSGAARRARAAA